MARGWRVLDATSFEGVVGGSRGRITLTCESEDLRSVAAEEIAVLLIGGRTSVTAAAMHYVTKHDIALLIADWRGVPTAGFYPWAEHGRVAARHLAQADLSLPRKKNAWMQLIRAKMAGQAATLRSVDPQGAERLVGLAKRVRSGDPSNAEGTAARLYWPRLFAGGPRFRRDQDAPDDINALLNYGYIVLRGYGIRAALGAGLSPPLGLFHRGRANYFNLVDDLIEPFRPAVDAAVVALGPAATLADPDVKRSLVASASQPFTPDGLRIPSVLDDLAQQVGRYVEGDVDRLSVAVWTGPKDKGTRADSMREDSLSQLDSEGDPPW